MPDMEAPAGRVPGSAESGPIEGMDWSSVEQVAGHVSRTTLASMQQLWRSHSTAMDSKGKQFAETVYALHAQAITEVASMKTFELKHVLATVNAFTSGVREAVMGIFQTMRQADDDFAQAVYQTSRRAFARTLREALEAWDASSAAKLRQVRASHAEQLETQRRAAEASAQQRLIAHEVQITKALKEEHKRKLTQAVTAVANLALAKDQEQQQQHQQQQQQQQQDPGQREAFTAGASKRPSFSNNGLQGGSSAVDVPRDGGSWRAARQENVGKESVTPRTPAQTTSVSLGEQRPGAAGQASQHPYNSIPGINMTGGAGPAEASPLNRPGTSALGLEVLSLLADDDEDSPVNNVLACKELEVQLRHAREEMQEQKDRLDEMNRQMQLQLADVGKWKDKWIQEGAKSDGIKRECLQIVTKCEQRVTALQQEHLAEMSKRDMVLQRSKDTILRLEAQLAANNGQHVDMRLLPHGGVLHSEAQGRQSPLQPHQRVKTPPPGPASGLGTEQPQHASPWKSPPGDMAPGALALQGLGLDAGADPELAGADPEPHPAHHLPFTHDAAHEDYGYPTAPPAPGGTSSARPSITAEQSMNSQGGAPSENGSNYFDD